VGLLLGSIGPATAPAGTIASLHDCKARRGTLSKMTTAIVGLDDGVAIIIFVIAIAILKVSLGEESLSVYSAIVKPVIEILGAIVLGIFNWSNISVFSEEKRGKREHSNNDPGWHFNLCRIGRNIRFIIYISMHAFGSVFH